jgi:benzoylformate decarboxylase
VGAGPASAARAAVGDAIVADVAAVARQLLDALPAEPSREMPPPRERPAAPRPATRRSRPMPCSPSARRLPGWVRLVDESTANTSQFWTHLDLDRPQSFFFPAAGGLGFGLPAAAGVALADPARPVVTVPGDGALQYGVTGLWAAARLGPPVTFVVLSYGGYGALRSFVARMGVAGAPGLHLPGLDAARIAERYGVPAERGSPTAMRRPPHRARAGSESARGPDHGGDPRGGELPRAT